MKGPWGAAIAYGQLVMSNSIPARTLDIYDLERAVVRARNRVRTLVEDKGDTAARKIFVLGHAHTATKSLHRAFQAGGVRSRHSAGNWRVARFDAFSDRGDYRPVDIYRATYPNARFILNTRPLGAWLWSTMRHRNRRHSAAQLVNTIYRRNLWFAQVVNMFADDDRLVIVDITRPGAVNFALLSVGLPQVADPPHANRSRRAVIKSQAVYDAVKAGPMGRFFDRPFLVPELLTRREAPPDGWQDAIANNLA